jgi:capsular polysaccharide biosynthesis protein
MGPQLITLTVKGRNPETVKDLWNSVADTTIIKNKQINIDGDPLLGIYRVSGSPIVRDVYRPLWLSVIIGGVFLPSLIILFAAIRRYFKWK